MSRDGHANFQHDSESLIYEFIRFVTNLRKFYCKYDKKNVLFDLWHDKLLISRNFLNLFFLSMRQIYSKYLLTQ